MRDLLEKRFRDMQDLEFTIEEGQLYLLQTRNGKRTGFAAVRIATDMVDEGLIDEDEAVLRVEPEQLVQLLAPVFPLEGEGGRGQGRPAPRRRGCPPAPAPRAAASRSRRDARRRDGGARATRRARARRDVARGHRRHARGRRDPDDARGA